jgi:hypothetical protein
MHRRLVAAAPGEAGLGLDFGIALHLGQTVYGDWRPQTLFAMFRSLGLIASWACVGHCFW